MINNYRKLHARIVEKFGTMGAFADVLGMSRQNMSAKMNGKTAFTVDDIKKWTSPELLDIEPSEIHEYFFS